MTRGVCPKCNSEEIYKGQPLYNAGLQTGFLVPLPPQTYVCTDCGYYEFYAFTGPDLDRVKERFEKVKK